MTIRLPFTLQLLLLASLYFVAGHLGLNLAFVQANVSPVWPASGLAVAILLMGGLRYWPAILVGAFAVNVMTPVSLAAAAGIAVGNTLEALAAAWFVQHMRPSGRWLERPIECLVFAVLAGMVSPMIAATIGVGCLVVSGAAAPSFMGLLWSTWWLGDAAGIFIYTPLILAWRDYRPKRDRAHFVEGLLLWAMLLVACWLAFGPSPFHRQPIAYLPVPLLVWAAFRFERVGATTGIFLVTLVANLGTVSGYGSFAGPDPNRSLALLQLFIGEVTLSLLFLSAVIGERAIGQRQLARSVALLEAEQQASPAGILLVDEHRRVISANRAFQDMWRLSAPVLASQEDAQLLEAVRPQIIDWDAFITNVEALMANPCRSQHDSFALTEGRVFERFTAPAVGSDGTLFGRVWFFKDVTDAIRLHESLKRSNEELQQLDRLKTAFVNTVSHELRTPLTSLVGFAEFLEDGVGGELSDVQADFVHQIQGNARRLIALVDDLLDFSRLEIGSLPMRVEYANLKGVVMEAVGAIMPNARAAGVSLAAYLPDDEAVIPIDARRIGQVLLNLVGNAIKFTPAGGKVTVEVKMEEPGAIVSVRDTGIGILESHLEHLFERFYQVDASTTRTHGGVGLGLAISRAIIEAHGGRLTVESTLGVGSTFRFTLPSVGPVPVPEAPSPAE